MGVPRSCMMLYFDVQNKMMMIVVFFPLQDFPSSFPRYDAFFILLAESARRVPSAHSVKFSSPGNMNKQ